MQETTSAYDSAIVGDSREIKLYSLMTVVSPDIEYGSVTASAPAQHSSDTQLYDSDSGQMLYATLEKNRWSLDGKFDIFPSESTPSGIGWVSNEVCNENGYFQSSVDVSLSFSGVSVLQVATLCFPGGDDGVAENFTFSVKNGTTVLHEETRTGNESNKIIFDGFTASSPDSISVSVTKWSIGNRKCRIMEILPGIFDLQSSDDIYDLDVLQQSDFTGLTCPYGSATLVLDNSDDRYNPFAKSTIFQSIEERQPVNLWIQILTDAGAEKMPLGVYYQKSGGWDINSFGLTATFKLVDIVGLLQTRNFVAPSPKPTTVQGWIDAVAAILGGHFECAAEASLGAESLTTTDSMRSFDCGNVLRFIAMATQSVIKITPETGGLYLCRPSSEPVDSITFDNMGAAPTLSASNDCVSITFTLADGSSTKHEIAGNSISGDTISLYNPFISTAEQADAAGAFILQNYGKTKISITSRGNPAHEIGDVITASVWGTTTARGRIRSRTIAFENGIMKSCKTDLIGVTQ